MVLPVADHGGSDPDLYQLLGVPRDASREEIAQAWRRRARAEHPDARPSDVAAPGRFRALAEAYQVLGDPARRAAYDRVLLRHDQPAARITTPPSASWRSPTGGPLVRAPGPPLRAGPVRVDGGYPERPAGGRDEQETRLAVLAELALRYLGKDRDWPW